MTITPYTTIAEIATTLPSSVRVFQRFGLELCCGGKMPIAAACVRQGVSFSDVVAAIDGSTLRCGADRDWRTEPLPALIEHIIAAYHDPLRDELPRLRALATKAAAVHGSKALS